MNALVRSIWTFDWLSAAIAAPFAVLLAWLVTAIIDRTPPISYEHVRPMVDSVPQGGIIEVEFTVFRTRICESEVRRWLTDSTGTRHSIPSFTVGPKTQLAGLDTYKRTITIPEAAAVGQAIYQVDIEYSCNLIHRLGWPIFVQSPPIRFEITPRPIIIIPPPEPPPDNDG